MLSGPDLAALERAARFQLRRMPWLRPHLEAEDLAQEAALRIMSGAQVAPSLLIHRIAVDQTRRIVGRTGNRLNAHREAAHSPELIHWGLGEGPEQGCLETGAQAALLRAQGLTFRAIGERLGISHEAAHRAVRRLERERGVDLGDEKREGLPRRAPLRDRIVAALRAEPRLGHAEIRRRFACSTTTAMAAIRAVREVRWRMPPGASHCLRGHDLRQPKAVRIDARGQRACAACVRIGDRRRHARKRPGIRRTARDATYCKRGHRRDTDLWVSPDGLRILCRGCRRQALAARRSS